VELNPTAGVLLAQKLRQLWLQKLKERKGKNYQNGKGKE
jgi:hypothetical protein